MPRLNNSVPTYRKHKASGQAVVTIGGKDVYLGPHGTIASRTEYDRIIGEFLTAGRRPPEASIQKLTIAEIALAFWNHAQSYYRKPLLNPDGSQQIGLDGKPRTEPTSEVQNLKRALRPLAEIYGRTNAADFGPLALKALRQHMIALGWCRRSVNSNIARIKQVFKWAVANELVPPHVYHGLTAVSGLRVGRTDAVEKDPVRAVPEQLVQMTLPHLSRHVGAMVELQLLTGMRPGEMCAMRSCDIETTGKLWLYRPLRHKTSHHGHQRLIYLGPRAQELLAPFLKPNLTAPIFSPAEAEAERRERLHAKRKTPLTCGNVSGSNRRARPQRQPGKHYTVVSYRRAIARACDRAFEMPQELTEPCTKKQREAEAQFPEEERQKRKQERHGARRRWRKEHTWHPHQLRHNAATRLRKEYGLEAAQVILGHKTLSVTELYAEKNVAKAQEIMAAVG